MNMDNVKIKLKAVRNLYLNQQWTVDNLNKAIETQTWPYGEQIGSMALAQLKRDRHQAMVELESARARLWRTVTLIMHELRKPPAAGVYQGIRQHQNANAIISQLLISHH